MTKKAITINNPFGWYVASGLIDVENRSKPTNYRGPLLIHVNKEAFAWPEIDDCPDKVIDMVIEAMEDKTPYEQLPSMVKGYEDLCRYGEKKLGIRVSGDEETAARLIAEAVKSREFPFVTSSVVGEVELVDCVKGFDSPWSAEGYYQYVFRNARLYDEPIRDVKGWLGIWNFGDD